MSSHYIYSNVGVNNAPLGVSSAYIYSEVSDLAVIPFTSVGAYIAAPQVPAGGVRPLGNPTHVEKHLGNNFGGVPYGGGAPFKSVIVSFQALYIDGSFGVVGISSTLPAFIRVASEIDTSVGCHISASAESSIDSYIAGKAQVVSKKLAYIVTPEPKVGNQPSYIWGQAEITSLKRSFIISVIDSPESSHDAYIDGHYVSLGSSSAYIHGWKGLVYAQPSFILSIIDAPESSKSAFIYGIGRPRLTQPAFIQIENPTDSSHLAFIQIETPMLASKSAMIVASEFVLDEDRWAYLRGLESARPVHPSYVHIETPLEASKAAFVNGPPIESDIGAFIFAPWVQSAFIQIETPLAVTKNLYARGHIAIQHLKRAHTRGAQVSEDGFLAFIQVITPMLSIRSAYIVTVEPRSLTKNAFVRGLIDERLAKPAYMFGHWITPPSAIGAYIRIGDPASAFKSAFIQIENEIYLSNPAFMRGLDELPVPNKMCFIDSRYIITANPQPAYVSIETPMNAPAKMCFIQIETQMPAPAKRAYIRNVGELQQPNLCFTLGGYITLATKSCYIHLPTPVVSIPQFCYVEWMPSMRGSTMCYIFETGINTFTQICYLNGDWEGAVDQFRRAFIEGRANWSGFHAAGPNAYIAGIIPTMSSNKPSYIVNFGLIGDWRFDDGQFDPGTSTIIDHSGTKNHGLMVNWPTWVEGPSRRDCT